MSWKRSRFSFRCVVGFAVLIACGADAARGAPVYPVKKSANNRYLVDQNNVPFLLVGDSPQALIVNISEAEAATFFADRSTYGFNTMWINLLCATYTGGRADGSTIDHILPFTATVPSTSSYDLTTPNEAYFAHVDQIVGLAAAQGIQVLLDPIETGSWLSVMLDNGLARCRTYGRYLGNRYRNFDNIVWMSGNDFQGWRDAGNDAVVREVARGILDNDTRHLHTTELDYSVSSSLDDPTWTGILGLNATYTYYPTYARLRQDYNRANFLPNFMVEANYEFESLAGPTTTPPILRKQEYWTMTSGATGQMYGNGYTWPFVGGWQANLDTPGAAQMQIMKTFFEPRAWYSLVPDTSHVVVTSGYGAYSDNAHVADNDYLTAARTPDGTLVVVYTPIVRTFTLDMTKLAAAATTRWFDPSDGAYVTVPGSPLPNTGTRNLAPPGPNGDGDGGWVLVLETQPVETQAPTVALTAPAPGAMVANTVQIAANASDNVGVVGVRFRIDGANFGAEDTSAPYAIAWNTLGFPNGPHEVKAVARDLAGNHGEDSLSVTVHNVIPPPPTDHLAAAYAFDESGGATTADASGHGNTATRHGGAAFAPGKHGNALAFDGTSAYAEAPNSATLDIGGTGFCIAFWAKVISTTSGVDYVLAGKPWSAVSMPSPFYQYGVEYSNSSNKTLDFFFGDGAASLHGPYRMSATPGVWTHVAFSYDGSTVKGYVDGVERLAVTDASSLQPRGNSLRLGVDGAYQQFFNGALDDLRLYNRALTPTEVQSVMQTPVGVVTNVPPEVDAARSGVRLEARSPFGATTNIAFALPAAQDAALQVLDVAGRVVCTLAQGTLAAGRHELEWNGHDAQGREVASGRYFLRLRAGGSEKTTAVVRVR